MRIVLSVVSTNPPLVDFFQTRDNAQLVNLKDLSTPEWLAMRQLNWTSATGTSHNGLRVAYIEPTKFSDSSQDVLLYYFQSHFPADRSGIELFIDARILAKHVVECLLTLTRFIGDRLRRIRLIGISHGSAAVLTHIDLSLWGQKLQIFGEFDSARFCFPANFFTESASQIPQFFVECFGAKCGLVPCGDGFCLTSDATIAGVPCKPADFVSFANISHIDELGDSLTIHLIDGAPLRLGTKQGKLLTAICKHCKATIRLPISPFLSLSGSPRPHVIAAALQILVSQPSLATGSALHLLEAALRNDTSQRFTANVTVPNKVTFGISGILGDLLQNGPSDEVALILSQHLAPDNIQRLLPLFIRVLNASTDRARLIATSWNLYNLCSPTLERLLWPSVTSGETLQCLVPMIMANSGSLDTARRTLSALVAANADFMGRFVVDRCLDAAIRRRPFNTFLTVDKVLNCVTTLPFNAPVFVMADLSRLLFCTIVGSLHVPQEVADNGLLFLWSSLHALESHYAGFNFSRPWRKIVHQMENAKVTDVITVLHSLSRISEAMDDVMHDEFMSLLCQSEVGDDPEIWCIKAAASAHFKYSDTSIALQLIQNLPSLLLTNFGFQKLALTFRSLGPLIVRFPDGSLIPMFFLWPALLSLSHQNQMLRRAALKLLARAIPWALDHGGFADINGLHTTRFISQAIVDSVSIYEESVGVSFSSNFAFALVTAMTRSLEEAETRKAAVAVLKTCIKRCGNRPQIAVYFALGFLAYAQEDPQSILGWVPTKSATVAAFIFKDFEQRMADDATAIVRYLGATFGSRHCAHRLEVIADCLVYGATRYPERLTPIRTNVIKMCWQLMDTELHDAKAEMIAGVCGPFFPLPDEKQAKVQSVGRIGDDALARCITGVVDGVAAALQLDFPSVRTGSA